MDMEPLKIKTQADYNWDHIIYINHFEKDSLEIIKRESKIGFNIYYIKYSTLRPFYFVINCLIGYIEEIEGSSDKYLVVLSSLRNKNIINVLDKIWRPIQDQINPNIKIKDCDKFRFNSDIDLPLNTAIDIDSVLKIDKRAYPQAYLEQCKYKLKKRKIVNYIDEEIIDEDSDSDIDDAIDSHLNCLVSDSYVKI